MFHPYVYRQEVHRYAEYLLNAPGERRRNGIHFLDSHCADWCHTKRAAGAREHLVHHPAIQTAAQVSKSLGVNYTERILTAERRCFRRFITPGFGASYNVKRDGVPTTPSLSFGLSAFGFGIYIIKHPFIIFNYKFKFSQSTSDQEFNTLETQNVCYAFHYSFIHVKCFNFHAVCAGYFLTIVL